MSHKAELDKQRLGLIILALGEYRDSEKYRDDGYTYHELDELQVDLMKQDHQENATPWARVLEDEADFANEVKLEIFDPR